MSPEQRTAINQQNAQHSTGPKTDEGKAKVSQNATTHGLSSSKPPLENPNFLKFLHAFQAEHKPQSPTAHIDGHANCTKWTLLCTSPQRRL